MKELQLTCFISLCKVGCMWIKGRGCEAVEGNIQKVLLQLLFSVSSYLFRDYKAMNKKDTWVEWQGGSVLKTVILSGPPPVDPTGVFNTTAFTDLTELERIYDLHCLWKQTKKKVLLGEHKLSLHIYIVHRPFSHINEILDITYRISKTLAICIFVARYL